MLIGYFFDIQTFTVDTIDAEQYQIKAIVRLNSAHKIFHGHFPGNPVVPGVCQVQMVKELAERALQQSLRLRESDNIKFLSMIVPTADPILDITLQIRNTDNQQYTATAVIGSGEKVFLKFKGKFEIEADA